MPQEFCRLEIDENRRAVLKGDRWIPLTETEYAILTMLNTGDCVNRHQLLTAIGGSNYHPTTRTVDQHIMRLRKKLGKRAIKTVFGMGYFL